MNYWLTDNRYVCWCFMSTWSPALRVLRSWHAGGDERGEEETGVESQEVRREKQMRGRQRRGERNEKEGATEGQGESGRGRAAEMWSGRETGRQGGSAKQSVYVNYWSVDPLQYWTELDPRGAAISGEEERGKEGGRERNGEVASRKKPAWEQVVVSIAAGGVSWQQVFI